MVVPTEQTCEKCGETYWQGCLRVDLHHWCDDCRSAFDPDDPGYIKPRIPEPPNGMTKDEWLKEIARLMQQPIRCGGKDYK